MKNNKIYYNRQSGIELLKIIAILIIIISHVVQSLGTNYSADVYNDYVVDISHSTTDITVLTLALLRYLGAIGNIIFFICTAWFMIDKPAKSKKKIFSLILDVWIISVILLVLVAGFRKGNVDNMMLIKGFFPVIFSNNWYISCYIVFCFIHPFLNEIIQNSDQKRLFRITFTMTLSYVVLNYFGTFLFANNLIIWIAIYLLIAYYKLYINHIDSIKSNLILLMVGMLGNMSAVLLTNFAGLKWEYLNDKILFWSRNSSPFLIMIALALFNIFKQFKFKSYIVNYISSLSLYIYLFHENPLVAKYLRSTWWHEIFIRVGHEHILFQVTVYSLMLFLMMIIISVIYLTTVHKLVVLFCERLYPRLTNVYIKVESWLIKEHKCKI